MKNIPELFDAQRELTPGAIALYTAGASVTYEALSDRADVFQEALWSLGVRRGDRVAMVLPRGGDAVALTLATMRVGAAYVPLAADWPTARVQFVLEDAKPRVVVSAEPMVAMASQDHRGVTVRELEQLGADSNRSSGQSDSSGDDDIAWVLYTSGSTGTPKGVLGTHTGSIVRVRWLWEHQPFAPGEVCFQNTALTTVDSVWEIWGPIGRGHAVLLLEDELVRDPLRLIPELARRDIRRICLVPSLLATILDLFPNLGAVAPSLRLWVASGEALTRSLCDRFYEAVPDGVLYNQYGLTETCADITSFDTRLLTQGASRSELSAAAGVAIGRAAPEVDVYVRDEAGNEVPQGVEGELYVGGPCLARGYLGREQETRERFVEEVVTRRGSAASSSRRTLLRTGDRVKLLPDGNLLYVGRRDTQVKIRGFRVELAEIVSALAGNPIVNEAAAVVHAIAGEKQIVAYVTLRGAAVHVAEEDHAAAELREALSLVLPAYMMPSFVCVLEAFPRTPTGKIDRRALPAPRPTVGTMRGGPPDRPTEKLVASAWQFVLTQNGLGLDDDFFVLGGHSLSVMRVMARLEAAIGRELPIRLLFENRTIRTLAERIDALPVTDRRYEEGPIPAVSRDTPIAASSAQARLWFLQQVGDASTYNIAYECRIAGRVSADALAAAWRRLVDRHEALRTTFAAPDGVPVQLIGKPQMTPAEMRVVDLSHLDADLRDEEARRLAFVEARAAFDLEAGPLARLTLIRLDQETHRLLLTIHHIVCDDTSVDIIWRDLSLLYGDAVGHESSAESRLRTPAQYADFAAWHSAHLRDEWASEERAYWISELQGAAELLPLPTDRPRPKHQRGRGATHVVAITDELTSELIALASRGGATLFMVLNAGLSALLARLAGASDVLIGTPTDGRVRTEFEDAIGFFVNTIVLRTNCDGEPTFTELLDRVRHAAVRAYDHHYLPFEQLVSALKVERSLAYHPVFQVMVALRYASDELRLPGAEVEIHESTTDTAKFDLNIGVTVTRAGRLEVTWEYDVALFEPATIARWASHWVRLLDAAARHPETRVRQLLVQTSSDDLRLVAEWNATEVAFAEAAASVHQLVHAQVTRTPDAIAVMVESTCANADTPRRRAGQCRRDLR
jgi:amino acid adenylation domain-containing protein